MYRRVYSKEENKMEEDIFTKENREVKPVIEIEEGDSIYDYCWFPKMNSNDTSTCFFISSSREHPIHMWDAYNGKLRATYRPYNHVDEISSPFSLSFDPQGERIFSGYNQIIRIFDVSTPGREYIEYNCGKGANNSRKKLGNANSNANVTQKGIISCFAFPLHYSSDSSFAVGTYDNSIGLYSLHQQSMISLLSVAKLEKGKEIKGDIGTGITYLKYSPNGRHLFSCSRKSNRIICWDLRYTSNYLSSTSLAKESENIATSPTLVPISELERKSMTNQHIGIDIDYSGSYLISGSLVSLFLFHLFLILIRTTLFMSMMCDIRGTKSKILNLHGLLHSYRQWKDIRIA